MYKDITSSDAGSDDISLPDIHYKPRYRPYQKDEEYKHQKNVLPDENMYRDIISGSDDISSPDSHYKPRRSKVSGSSIQYNQTIKFYKSGSFKDNPAVVRKDPVKKKSNERTGITPTKKKFKEETLKSNEKVKRNLLLECDYCDSFHFSNETCRQNIFKQVPEQHGTDTLVSSPDTEDEIHDNSDVEMFKKWPIFKRSDSVCLSDAIMITQHLLDPPISKVCKEVPKMCDENFAFLIDVSCLDDERDLTCDDNGKFMRASFSTTTFILGENGPQKSPRGDIMLVRKYARHQKSANFYRTIYQLKYPDNRKHNIVALKYHWRNGKEQLEFAAHANSKKEKEYIRTKPSVIDKIKTSNNPSSLMKDLYAKEGGSENITTFSSVPRDRNQIYRHSTAPKSRSGPCRTSNFSSMMKMGAENSFVRSFEMSDGKPRAFLTTDDQINDLKTYCCNDSIVLAFDPTFNLGNFYLTPTTFRHRMFVNSKNNKPVLMPGPMLMHTTRDTGTYEYFGNCLSKALLGKQVRIFGTDGEKALVNGLKLTPSFKNSTHFTCMEHSKANCDEKLSKLGVKNTNRIKILRNIYGKQEAETRYEGLVDCDTACEFDQLLAEFEVIWNSLEQVDTEKPPVFSQWFRKNKSLECKSMLRPIRDTAKFLDGRQYTTNDNEAFNSLIKRKCGKKNTWEEMVTSVKEIIQSKYEELTLGIHGSGDRQLSQDYVHYQLTEHKWSRMTPQERQAHLIKVKAPSTVTRTLSIRHDEFSIPGFTGNELQQVWWKAENILSQEVSVVPSSGQSHVNTFACFGNQNDVFQVRGHSEKCLFTCETSKCKSFIFFDKKLCEHTICVAEYSDVLANYLSTITINEKTNTSTVNRLIDQQCHGAGKKGKQSSKRKGYNNNTGMVPTFTVGRPTCELAEGSETPNQADMIQPFSVSFKAGLIRTCYGCKRNFADKYNHPPNDIILKHLDIRHWKDPKSGSPRASANLVPTYFHLKMDCVRCISPYTEAKDIVIFREIYIMLTPAHKDKLRGFGVNV